MLGLMFDLMIDED